jgi:hypothetical protein
MPDWKGVLGGLYIDYQLNDTWKFSTGGLLTTDYWLTDFRFPTQSANPQGAAVGSRVFGSVIGTFRLPLLAHCKLADVSLFRTKQQNPPGRLLRFRLEGTLGVSYQQVILASGKGYQMDIGERIVFDAQNYMDLLSVSKQKSNLGLVFGLGLQFQNLNHKNLFRLDFQYTQGIGNMFENQLTYSLNGGETFKGIIASKGSAFWLQFSMPIRVSRLSK